MLLPVRDGATHLDRAMASLVRQTLREIEIVAVDDGSTDRTPALLEAWAVRDRRIVVVRTPPRGIVPALEEARARASAPWLARMDADDVSHPERLAAQLALLEESAGLVGCGTRVRYFPEARVAGGARRYERWLNRLVTPGEIERAIFVECPLAHPTFFLRADAVEAVGGYRDLGWPEDHDLVLRLWEAGGRFAKVPRTLLRWRERPDRLSRNHPAYAPEAFRRLKIHFLRRTLLVGRGGAVVWGAGPTGKAFALALREAGVGLRAFVDVDPRKLGQEVHGVPVIAAEGLSWHADALVLAAVGREGAREEVRRTLRASGLREMVDFVCVA